MEIPDERCGDPGIQHPLLDLGHCGGGLGQVHRDPHHLGPRLGQLDTLPRGGHRVDSVGHGHRLDHHRRAATHLDISDAHPDGPVQSDHWHVSTDFSIRRSALACARGSALGTGRWALGWSASSKREAGSGKREAGSGSGQRDERAAGSGSWKLIRRLNQAPRPEHVVLLVQRRLPVRAQR